MGLPNLFVIGAPKAGTTSLHSYLGQHPKITMSSVKEPKFYLTAGGRAPDYRGPGDAKNAKVIADRATYEALFPDLLPAGHYAGEASPYYLWDTQAARRIRAEVPDARLVAVLRDPVIRAYSNWAHLWWSGREAIENLPDAIAAEDSRRRAGWEPFWFYRSIGRYGEQLNQLYTVFPRDQVKVVLAEELKATPQAVLDDIFRFLDLPSFEVDLSRELNRSIYVPMDRRTRSVQAAVRTVRRAGRVFPPWLWRAGKRTMLALVGWRDQPNPGLPEETYRQVAELFEDERPLLSSLGVDVNQWGLRRLAETRSAEPATHSR